MLLFVGRLVKYSNCKIVYFVNIVDSYKILHKLVLHQFKNKLTSHKGYYEWHNNIIYYGAILTCMPTFLGAGKSNDTQTNIQVSYHKSNEKLSPAAAD